MKFKKEKTTTDWINCGNQDAWLLMNNSCDFRLWVDANSPILKQ